MTKIAIIIGSTRPGRFGPQVAQWFAKQAEQEGSAEFEVVDIAEYALPVLDEETPGVATNPNALRWSKAIDSYDGFIYVTPEYNHSIPGSFKNAIDYLNKEWSYKPVAYISYGWAKGHRSVEAWRSIAAQFYQYDLREEINIQLDGTGVFTPNQSYNQQAADLVKAVKFWSEEFKQSRKKLAK